MPWDKSKYPANWTEIRTQILARAGNRCEFKGCGVPNHAFGYRDKQSNFHPCEGMAAETAALDGEKIIRIVLTIAHLENPDPMDCRPENLAAYCQLHHLRHDAKQHGRNAAATRARKKRELSGQLSLLELIDLTPSDQAPVVEPQASARADSLRAMIARAEADLANWTEHRQLEQRIPELQAQAGQFYRELVELEERLQRYPNLALTAQADQLAAELRKAEAQLCAAMARRHALEQKVLAHPALDRLEDWRQELAELESNVCLKQTSEPACHFCDGSMHQVGARGWACSKAPHHRLWEQDGLGVWSGPKGGQAGELPAWAI